MSEETQKKIGILVGGGPAPEINSVIHAVALEVHRNGTEIVEV
jgi:6-phosphofructokinase 1